MRDRIAIAALMVCAGMSVAYGQGPPEVTVPKGKDILGNPYQAPGAWMGSTVSATNWNISTPAGGELDGVGSNNLIVTAPSIATYIGGPVAWTTGWTNEGDFDANLGPWDASLDRCYPDQWEAFKNPERLELTSGDPTYAWALHPAVGVVLMSTRNNGRDNENTFFDAPVGTLYGNCHPVANDFRSGPAYNPVTGNFGNGSGTMYLSMQAVGLGEEHIIDCASAFFPFAGGWIGGYSNTGGTQFNDFPPVEQFENLAFPGQGYTELNFPSTNGEFADSGLTDNVAAVFEGDLTVAGGSYTFYTESDDSSYLLVEVDGEFVQVVDNGGTHGMIEEQGTIDLDAGTYAIRVNYYERGGGAGLIVTASGEELGAQDLLTFDAPTDTTYYNFNFTGEAQWLVSLDQVCATPGLSSGVVQWDNGSLATGDIVLPDITPADGMIFANSTGNSNVANVISLNPGDEGWQLSVLEDEDLSTSALTDGSFDFVYVPMTAENLVGAYVDGATGDVVMGEGDFEITRTGTGDYSLTIDGKADEDGSILLQVADEEGLEPIGAFMSYEYNAASGAFDIQVREIGSGDDNIFGEGYFGKDASFYFVWVDFTNPLSLGTDCIADCNGDGDLSILDFVCFQQEWQAQTDLGDCNGDGEYSILDFVCFQLEFQAGCN